jgi:N-acetylneuraminic acid mutarotase
VFFFKFSDQNSAHISEEEEEEEEGVCGTYGGEERNIQIFGGENWKETALKTYSYVRG